MIMWRLLTNRLECAVGTREVVGWEDSDSAHKVLVIIRKESSTVHVDYLDKECMYDKKVQACVVDAIANFECRYLLVPRITLYKCSRCSLYLGLDSRDVILGSASCLRCNNTNLSAYSMEGAALIEKETL